MLPAIYTAIARRWMLPDTVSQCMQECRVYDTSDPFCVANVVRLANALAKREGYFVGEKPSGKELDQHIEAGMRLLGIDERTIGWMAQTLGDRLQDAA